MKRLEQNGVHWMQFDLLSDIPGILHGVFLRHGGVSTGTFNSLNVGFKGGDTHENVSANVSLIKKALGISTMMLAKQMHSATVAKIGSNYQVSEDHCDALMSSLPDIGMLIAHADCQAAIFYDPINHVAANVHSGWRGSVQNIYAETVMEMRKAYNTSPQELLVCISPSLGPEHSEFVNYRTELPENFWEYQIKPNYFDFWGISQMQLRECGVLPHHIEIAGISTYGNTQDCFSYRREKVTGRNGTVIALKKR